MNQMQSAYMFWNDFYFLLNLQTMELFCRFCVTQLTKMARKLLVRSERKQNTDEQNELVLSDAN